MKTLNASVSVGFAARSVAAAFWLGVLVGVFAACSALVVAQAYSLVKLSVPQQDNPLNLLHIDEFDL